MGDDNALWEAKEIDSDRQLYLVAVEWNVVGGGGGRVVLKLEKNVESFRRETECPFVPGCVNTV